MSAPKTTLDAIAPEPESAPTDPVIQAFSDFVSDIGARIANELRSAEQFQAARLLETLAALRDSVRRELSENLREEFESRFRESMAAAKQQFTEKLQEASARLEEERSQFLGEIDTARRRASEISAELISKQSELEHLNRETAKMVEDPNIELSKIIRHNAKISELKAYVQGLHYLAGGPDKEKTKSD